MNQNLSANLGTHVLYFTQWKTYVGFHPVGFKVVIRPFPVAPAPATYTTVLSRPYNVGKIFMGPPGPVYGYRPNPPT